MIERTSKIRMAAGFVVRAAMVAAEDEGYELGPTITAGELQEIAERHPELFPDGLTIEQAHWLLDNPNTLVDACP